MSDDPKIIDGKEIAKKIRQDLKVKVDDFISRFNRAPGLSVALIGENPASQIYVNMKEKACKKVGINSVKHVLPKDVSQREVLDLVKNMNEDPKVDGILVQLPLPSQLDSAQIIESISPLKDVDGFHPISVGKLSIGEKTLLPCTPAGIIKLIESTGVKIEGKRAVIIGRSNIVGKPVAALLLKNHATVTICHSRTKDIPELVGQADILVAAIGKPEFVKGNCVKEGAVVIDVGVNRLDDGTLKGDVEFEEAKKRAAFITPVPKGVGPMTIAMLLENTYRAALSLEENRS